MLWPGCPRPVAAAVVLSSVLFLSHLWIFGVVSSGDRSGTCVLFVSPVPPFVLRFLFFRKGSS